MFPYGKKRSESSQINGWSFLQETMAALDHNRNLCKRRMKFFISRRDTPLYNYSFFSVVRKTSKHFMSREINSKIEVKFDLHENHHEEAQVQRQVEQVSDKF